MKVVLVAVTVVAIGTTSALGARSAASPFELVVSGSHEAVPNSPVLFPFGVRHKGTFVASSPFCSSFDAVAPTIRISSAKATKLRRPAESYSVRVMFSMRDNEAQHSLAYFVALEPRGGGLYLAQKSGSTATGRVTTTLRVTAPTGLHTVQLHLRAEDPVGNWRWLTRTLKLPR